MAVSETTYVQFQEFDPPKSRATKMWDVRSVHGDQLGTVQWFGRWRGYCFYPAGLTIFSPGCLNDISKFCTDMTSLHKEKNKEMTAAYMDKK